MLYKINIQNRNYGSWTIFHADTFEPIDIPDLNPLDYHLFDNDVFNVERNSDNKIKTINIIHSSIRMNDNIPAVLILENNHTYGREKQLKPGASYSRITARLHGGKLLYKCIPDDKRIPAFLVPYEFKTLGFNKNLTNMYVTIKFKSWDDKHPRGILSQVIGTIDILDNFYEYQLYCKSLNTSIQNFNKQVNKVLNMNTNHNENSNHESFIESIYEKHRFTIEDRTDWNTFTIDPETSLDYDDGFSIKKLNDNQSLLSIYIANVTIWMDCLNLWTSFSQRIATIYLPDRKRPMLPTVLSDCLCSLQKNRRRFAFVLDLLLNNDCEIVSANYCNTLICVKNNFAYEEHKLLNNDCYKELFETTKKMSKKYKYMTNIKDSHDVVSYLMILMNYKCANELFNKGNGIFRSLTMNAEIELPDSLPDDVAKFIKIWNSSSAQYLNLETMVSSNLKHDILNMDTYIHITSPIRRLVDLLNMIRFQLNNSLLSLSHDALEFYDKWIGEINYINTTMRAIRKVQTDCSLLDLCFNEPSVLEKEYEGYCFDKLSRNDGLFQYMVFLPDIKLTSRMTIREDINNYDKRLFKLFIFKNEENFKRKIRLQLL